MVLAADLGSTDAQSDPHGLFAGLREEAGPVVWSQRHRAWLVLAHRAMSDGFRDRRLSSDRVSGFEAAAARRPDQFGVVVDLLRGWMVFRDPPVHTALREPVRAAFTPRRVAALEASVTRQTEALLDAVADLGACDLRRVLAQPLPAMVVAELLGVPDADRAEFRTWSDRLSRVVFAVTGEGVDAESAAEAAASFAAYFSELIEHYRRHPADNLLTVLGTRSGGNQLRDSEIVGAAALLFFAGHETTTTLISNAVWCLLTNPAELDRLRGRKDLWPSAIEELMRYEGPAKVMVRKAVSPFVWEGVEIAAGDSVFLVIAAANRDPTVFAEPDRLDVGRHPNPHLGFGWGIHHCLGAALARLEAQVVLSRLFTRFPRLRPTTDAPKWGGGVLGRAVVSVPVEVR